MLKLTIFPEAPGKRIFRPEVNRPVRKLSQEEEELGAVTRLPDGIHIVTVSANTPPALFEAAHFLDLVSAGQRNNGFVPTDHYDSAIAIVNGRVIGGVLANIRKTCTMRKVLSSGSERPELEACPTIWGLWVHPGYRQKGVGRQLLEAMATHFNRGVAELGFWLPISDKAVSLLKSMGIDQVLGCL